MIVLALFSYDILLIYIGKEEIAVNTYILLSLVAVGNGLNSLIWLPYSLQLAHGWTKLAFYINLVMIFFLVPLMVFGVYQYGAVGGATAWVILNVSYFFTSIQMMHRRILKGEQWKWYFEDLALPFVVAISVAGIGKILLPVGGTRFETIITILTISAITFLFTAFSTKATRHYLRNFRSMLLHYAGRNKQILKNE
jgi:O-antigen/teichoic acid export membrane protein